MRPSKFWNVIFVMALMLTLFKGQWNFLSRLGWTLLPMLFMIKLRFAVYALFFFAPFFHPTGFFPDLAFSIKHFQLAAFLAVVAHLMKEGAVQTWKHFYRELARHKFLIYDWGALFFLAMLSSLMHGESLKTCRTISNLTLTLAIVVYILSLLKCRLDVLSKGLLYLSFGTAVNVGVAFFNELMESSIWGLDLIHNNHVGIMCAMLTFVALSGYLAEQNPGKRILYFILTLAILLGLVLSCSRTAWLSFVLSYIVYTILNFRVPPCPVTGKNHACRIQMHFPVIIGCLSVAGFILADPKIGEYVTQRALYIFQIFSIDAWRYAFQDHQNFGFLGIFRLNQFISIGEILATSPLVGVGFSQAVTDFHSFYLTLIGGSGLAGFAFFAAFAFLLVRKLSAAARPGLAPEWHIIRNGVFPALLTWFLSCLMQNMFLQFFIWITVGTALFLIECANLQPAEQSPP